MRDPSHPPVAEPGPRERLSAETRALFREWRRRGRRAPPISMTAAALAALVCVVVIALTAFYIDEAAARLARTLPHAAYRTFAQITLLGTAGYIFVIAALIAVFATVSGSVAHGRRIAEGLRLLAGRAMLLIAVELTTGIASQGIKHLVGRARPRLIDKFGALYFDPFSFTAVQASFPSGHTITAFATAWTLGLFLPQWRMVMFLLAILVAASRIALGSHYPADVIGGAAIGLAAAWLTCRAFAARRIVLRFENGVIVPRGRGLVIPALRAMLGPGKARP